MTKFFAQRTYLWAPAIVATAILGYGWLGAGPAMADPSTVTVCSRACDFAQIAPAIAAAPVGGTVRILAGSFHGGLVIEKSLTLEGAGAAKTSISGGGPVITAGGYLAATEPTIVIRGVTIKNGITRASQGRTDEAVGGGVYIPPAAGYSLGATVLIDDSVITDNVAEPAEASSSPSGVQCPTGPCPFALGGGGGIDSWGTLTVRKTTVSQNIAGGSLASDADGGGIFDQQGAVSLIGSEVTLNRALAEVPNGRWSEGAGVMASDYFSPNGATQAVSISGSSISDNTSSLTSTLPSLVDGSAITLQANGSGVHVGDDTPIMIANSSIDGNTTIANDPVGETAAIDAGLQVGDSNLVMKHSQVLGNRTITLAATDTDVGPSGSAVELDGPGTISDSRISDNETSSTSTTGDMESTGTVSILNFNSDASLVTIERSTVADNNVTTVSAKGEAKTHGGGIINNALLLLNLDVISGNMARATGHSASAEGGGIWNGIDLSGPPVQLTVRGAVVSGNAVGGSVGASLAGGGVYAGSPVTFVSTQIVRNQPDQCAGSGC